MAGASRQATGRGGVMPFASLCPGRSATRAPPARSRASRRAMREWCAADTDLGFTRDRHSNARKSGEHYCVTIFCGVCNLRFELHSMDIAGAV
jgi:hypothetical protein